MRSTPSARWTPIRRTTSSASPTSPSGPRPIRVQLARAPGEACLGRLDGRLEDQPDAGDDRGRRHGLLGRPRPQALDEAGQLVEPVARRVPVVGLPGRRGRARGRSRRPRGAVDSACARGRRRASARAAPGAPRGAGTGARRPRAPTASQPAPSPSRSRGPDASSRVSTERARTRGSRKVAESTSEPRPIALGRLGERDERRPALQHRRRGVGQRLEVVAHPDVVEACSLRAPRGVAQLREGRAEEGQQDRRCAGGAGRHARTVLIETAAC